METLVGAAAFTAFNIAIRDMDEGEKEDWKLKLMSIWEKQMGTDFQKKLSELNKIKLDERIEHRDLLPDAEDFQLEFNEIVKDVKKIAAKALWPNKF